MTVLEMMRNFIYGRRLAYVQTFGRDNQAAQRVLYDLSKFCRGNKTTFHSDPRLHAVLEGRREVWLRILDHLKLTEDELWSIYGRKDLE